MPYRAYIITW